MQAAVFSGNGTRDFTSPRELYNAITYDPTLQLPGTIVRFLELDLALADDLSGLASDVSIGGIQSMRHFRYHYDDHGVLVSVTAYQQSPVAGCGFEDRGETIARGFLAAVGERLAAIFGARAVGVLPIGETLCGTKVLEFSASQALVTHHAPKTHHAVAEVPGPPLDSITVVRVPGSLSSAYVCKTCHFCTHEEPRATGHVCAHVDLHGEGAVSFRAGAIVLATHGHVAGDAKAAPGLVAGPEWVPSIGTHISAGLGMGYGLRPPRTTRKIHAKVASLLQQYFNEGQGAKGRKVSPQAAVDRLTVLAGGGESGFSLDDVPDKKYVATKFSQLAVIANKKLPVPRVL